jgi:hypothetical protein
MADQSSPLQGTAKRGFATMSPDVVRELARRGGIAAHRLGTAHEFARAVIPDDERYALSPLRHRCATALAPSGSRVATFAARVASLSLRPLREARVSPSFRVPLKSNSPPHSSQMCLIFATCQSTTKERNHGKR